MKITNPELKVVRFNADDVIATSLYWTTSEAYEAATGVHFDTAYVMFNGDMISTGDPNEYIVGNVRAATGMDEDDKWFLFGGDTGMGYSFPGTAGASYVPYYRDGNWYTNGVSYSESNGQ